MANSVTSAPVLIADDESADVQILRHRLISAGLKNPVFGVDTGEELLRFLEGSTFGGLIPPLVFLDLKMPGMSGLDALKVIRRHPVLRQMGVVVLTNSDDPRHRSEAAELDVSAYMLKFPTVAELTRLLQRFNVVLNAPSESALVETAGQSVG
jgi:CheY-like chemotaxis protein